jgi:hypothetical protein
MTTMTCLLSVVLPPAQQAIKHGLVGVGVQRSAVSGCKGTHRLQQLLLKRPGEARAVASMLLGVARQRDACVCAVASTHMSRCRCRASLGCWLLP